MAKASSTGVTIRKLLFLLFGRIVLMDPIRNFTYQWAWSHLKRLPLHSSICDVGSRNSPFPAFLAWQGFLVTAIDPDHRFYQWQENIRTNWYSTYQFITSDVCDCKGTHRFSATCALFSLQHAGERDSKGFTTLCRLLKPEGLLLTANEFDPKESKWERGRDDGDLRIYSPADLKERIELPIISSGMTVIEKRYARAQFKKGKITWTKDETEANICLICAKKE